MQQNIATIHPLFNNIALLIEQAKQYVVTTVNTTMVHTYFEIGRMIVEEEQQGKQRATYGKHIIEDLSVKLTTKFGQGFSQRNLEQMRQFYIRYSIPQTVSAELKVRKFTLSWSHYLILMRIENIDARSFYEIEATENHWTLKTLRRQINSALFERLALSRDKEGIKNLAEQGQIIEKPIDVIKDPYILEFLGLEEETKYSEEQLETRILDHLQQFLLELGKGFTFVGRQVRFTFEEEHFRVDLVFYNRLLRSFVVIDLKLSKLSHKDLGQMQMYVNYYDRKVKLEDENPTIGILLCQSKNDAVVEMTLPKDANIFASAYSLYLPDKKLLQEKLAEWIAEFEE
jgi:predicted nuclease of restriction endonuclease-like (RecB) superfamily